MQINNALNLKKLNKKHEIKKLKNLLKNDFLLKYFYQKKIF